MKLLPTGRAWESGSGMGKRLNVHLLDYRLGLLLATLIVCTGCNDSPGAYTLMSAGMAMRASDSSLTLEQRQASGLLADVLAIEGQRLHETQVARAGRSEINVNVGQAGSQRSTPSKEAPSNFYRGSLANGAYYEGEIRNGKLDGFGTWMKDGWKYVGQIRAGLWDGQGTMTWPEGHRYVGEWKNGKRHGEGTFTYADGQKYVGEWKNDKRHGQGTNTNPDGSRYVGQWKSGKHHGYGTLTSPDGTVQSGYWRAGDYIGEAPEG